MRILYFAWVRQKVGAGSEDVSPPPEVADIGSLMAWLASRSPGHASAFADPKQVRAAVNQEFCGPDGRVGPGDEVAFFPPVTGG
ncbi:molybdopterin converting factor subunit 1 [Pseudoroseomonas wenyumeiae]|uniref:Molybdopterin synthase sulfur carrier subunit n=1 Tax=Teichococcus wenyumeiae TaxID=2478470 RepID=A0A3A9JL21_9PROT|nr:molybdopterin converting factor subunit 1 [Pseudoroseomonas wenyumeiae]RKK05891.1 molybdopterin converting factor subunit 1 [Pseudoroseomonas wenyumeiae]RMI25880.1 molybdopterin converting factor subunit 1 [Pseudoroseomonas wenyumeiae]